MRVVITGGNGFLGRPLVASLRQRGDYVAALVLPGEDPSWLTAQGAEIYRGDILDAESLAAASKGAHKIVHLAAMQHVWRPLSDYRRVNVEGTRNVCRAALMAGVERVVHISSGSIYARTSGKPVQEGDPLGPCDDPYAVSKAEADLMVQRMIRDEGLPAVILRPAQIFGPGDSVHFGQMARRLQTGRGVIVGCGGNSVPFIYLDDAVQGLILALDHPAAVGHVFNLANDETVTQFEIQAAIARALGLAGPRVRVPRRAIYLVGWAAETTYRACGLDGRPPVTRFGVDFMGTDARLSIEAARTELGFVPQVPLLEGVKRAADWYRREDATQKGLDSVRPLPLPVSRPRRRRLVGEVALVTGASSGIGAATARELASRGAQVVLAARREALLQDQVRAITEGGGLAVAMSVDLADPSQVAILADSVVARFGRVDLLVNNAGRAWSEPFAESGFEELLAVVGIDLLAAITLTRAVLPGMLERRHGAVISVGSLSGRVAMEPVYSAAKFGIRGFSLALRRQLRGTGVSVSLVSPGRVRTAMTAEVRSTLPPAEMVARTIADLAVRPRREVVVPRRHYAIAWLEQVLPGLSDRVYTRRHWSPVRSRR